MNDPFTTYLHDHLAGADFAVDLVTHLRDQNPGAPLGEFAVHLLAEIEQDRTVLQELVDRSGQGSSLVKGAVAWLGEKVSRLKLSGGAFGTFETLEALSLGIVGKLAMWRALASLMEADARVAGIDFDPLVSRAQEQHSRVEEWRLQAARAALA